MFLVEKKIASHLCERLKRGINFCNTYILYRYICSHSLSGYYTPTSWPINMLPTFRKPLCSIAGWFCSFVAGENSRFYCTVSMMATHVSAVLLLSSYHAFCLNKYSGQSLPRKHAPLQALIPSWNVGCTWGAHRMASLSCGQALNCGLKVFSPSKQNVVTGGSNSGNWLPIKAPHYGALMCPAFHAGREAHNRGLLTRTPKMSPVLTPPVCVQASWAQSRLLIVGS